MASWLTPFSTSAAPGSVPHISLFSHRTPVLSQHPCIISSFHLPLFSPHLPMSPLFPFPQNIPNPPIILARDKMCLSYRYLFTAWPFSTHMLSSSCSEVIQADISPLAYSGPSFESFVSLQPQMLISLIFLLIFQTGLKLSKILKSCGRNVTAVGQHQGRTVRLCSLKTLSKKKREKIWNNYLKYNYFTHKYHKNIMEETRRKKYI